MKTSRRKKTTRTKEEVQIISMENEMFEEIMDLVFAELPKHQPIPDRQFEGIISYHCATRHVDIPWNDREKMKEMLKQKLIEKKESAPPPKK